MVQSVSPHSSGAGAVSPLVALQATLQQMREQTDARALIQLTLEYVKAVFGAPLIWLALYDHANHQLVGQGGVTLREEDRPLLQAAYPLQPGEILEQVVFEQRPISVPDLSQEPRMGLWQREAKRLGGIQGCFIYPFSTVGRRRCLGILMLGSQLWGATTHEEEKALLGILLGQLAASLQKLEDAWKRQAEKRFEESLLRLGAAMCQAGSLQERVSLVTQELQSCLGAVHIQVYWHKPSEGRFVPHESAARPTPAPTARGTKAGVIPMGEGSLALRELGNLYSSLAAGQVVVGDLETTRSEVPLKLMQQWRAQSALAAPIRLQQELLGFIWVQSEVPRTWQAAERQLVAAAAHGLALATPLENLDRRLRQLANDQEFVHQVGQALSNPAQLQRALQQAVVGLGQRLQAAAVAVLTLDPNQPIPRLFYEYRSEGQQALPQQFSSLSEQDWQDLLRSEVVVAENYDQDLRLLSWRQELAPLGVRSLMLTHTEVGGSATPAALPQGLILVLHPQRRAWSREERQLLRGIAQPVGLILRQIQLEQRRQRQEQLFNGLVAACLTLQNLTTLPELYAATVQQTAQALGIPLALVVSWQLGESRARLQPPFAAAPAFYPTGPTEIDRQDPLLTRALQARGPLQLSQDQIPAASRTWLNSDGPGILAAAAAGRGRPRDWRLPRSGATGGFDPGSRGRQGLGAGGAGGSDGDCPNLWLDAAALALGTNAAGAAGGAQRAELVQAPPPAGSAKRLAGQPAPPRPGASNARRRGHALAKGGGNCQRAAGSGRLRGALVAGRNLAGAAAVAVAVCGYFGAQEPAPAGGSGPETQAVAARPRRPEPYCLGGSRTPGDGPLGGAGCRCFAQPGGGGGWICGAGSPLARAVRSTLAMQNCWWWIKAALIPTCWQPCKGIPGRSSLPIPCSSPR
jgi:GAF domain-containing protein